MAENDKVSVTGKKEEEDDDKKYPTLYRRHRPKRFDDVVGQEHVATVLKNEIKRDKIGNAYLFCGTRGTGKTTVARIFARAINCEHPIDGEPCDECESCKAILKHQAMDIFELDAASYRKIENIRDINREVSHTPSKCKKSVYIIDEVHMLVREAANAFLKTLEEPPKHAVFILCTTEPHKILPTILSRCQRFDFRRINTADIEKRLREIADEEKIDITDDAIELIAEAGNGSMRDALSLLDRCSYIGGKLDRDAVVKSVGLIFGDDMFSLVDSVAENDTVEAVKKIGRILKQSLDPMTFFDDFAKHLRALLICKECSDMKTVEEILEVPPETVEKYKLQSEKLSSEQLIYGATVMADSKASAKSMSDAGIMAEIALIKVMRPEYSGEYKALSARIDKLENTVRAGGAMAPVSPSAFESSDGEALSRAQTQTYASPQRDGARTTEGAASDGGWSMWPEVLDTVKKISKSLYVYLYKAFVTKEGNVVTVKLPTKFAYDKVATSKGVEYLSELFSNVSKGNLIAKVVYGDEVRVAKPGASIMDIANKKDIYGDIIKIEGE